MAKPSGFCFGVRRALELTLNAKEIHGAVVTYGELIHNRDVVRSLSNDGIKVIEHLSEANGRTVVIRSHGVSKAFYDEAEALGIHLIDGTCPFVKKIHRLVDHFSQDGSAVMIVGNSEHPEVTGIAGWCHGPVYVVESLEALALWEAECLKINGLLPESLMLVAQTTIRLSLWEEIYEALNLRIKNLTAHNTICKATSERQDAAEALSKEVDCMLVVGGTHSSNTKKLYEICKKNCENTYFIESEQDLKVINVLNCDNIGITAGASTPDWVIDQILNQLKILNS
jgi:4-hydroxy-3-methylbut-2-enyl diphosphate reductase